VVLIVTSFYVWKHGTNHPVPIANAVPTVAPYAPKPVANGPEVGETLIASNDSGDFALLPGTIPEELDDSTVIRVQMQRGALTALGLSVNEEHAADLVQVDLLVGADGAPQAYRLPQSTAVTNN